MDQIQPRSIGELRGSPPGERSCGRLTHGQVMLAMTEVVEAGSQRRDAALKPTLLPEGILTLAAYGREATTAKRATQEDTEIGGANSSDLSE